MKQVRSLVKTEQIQDQQTVARDQLIHDKHPYKKLPMVKSEGNFIFSLNSYVKREYAADVK